MACLPCEPCYSAYYHPVSVGCSNTMVTSNNTYYVGPNLPNSGVANGDCLTLALEKIDNNLSAASLLAVIEANPTLKAQLCAIISSC